MRHRLRGIAQEKKPLNYQISVADVHRPRPILIRNFYLEFPIQSFKKGVKYSRKKKHLKLCGRTTCFFFLADLTTFFYFAYYYIARFDFKDIYSVLCMYICARSREIWREMNKFMNTVYLLYNFSYYCIQICVIKRDIL